MTSYWRKILDLTYHVTAMFNGVCFNNLIHEVFDDRQIKDLWLPFFTVITDISDSSMSVHSHGNEKNSLFLCASCRILKFGNTVVVLYSSFKIWESRSKF